jgi:hypothetical protein
VRQAQVQLEQLAQLAVQVQPAQLEQQAQATQVQLA